ncbi:MAG TPA: ATP-binding cassette domain-containing protein [Gammaproteobacteria bacterium]|nr:ATP-binding cassette domain-containing protein [Gammaproteobacteria bacterium]
MSSEAADTVVAARGLIKRYSGNAVVNGVDLTVRRGECFALLGPNGAGKTTTLRMLLGLTPPSAGRITVLGHDIPADARGMRRRAGVVPQFDNLDPDFTVAENLITYASFFGIPARAMRRRLPDLLAFAELTQRADAPLQALSGGMKRRLTLARTLVNDPELLVLDEPTTGLDPQARQHIWQRLHGLQREGRTLVLTTHYMEEAERLCDRAAVMDAGRIVACDAPAGLIRTHIEPHVVELRGEQARAWHERAPKADVRALRVEQVGETVLIYGRDRNTVLTRVEAVMGERYLYRPANLEDVFLKLTGRDLRD